MNNLSDKTRGDDTATSVATLARDAAPIVTHPPGTMLPLHPLATLFPPMSEQDFGRLMADIQANGPREPVTTMGGYLLDGVNRQRAHFELGIPLRACEFAGPGTPLAFVLSKNLARRHLNEKERSAVGAKLVEMMSQPQPGGAVEPLANLPTDGETNMRDRAAKLMNVSSRSIGSALKVRKEGTPELFALVESSAIAPSVAATLTDLPRKEQVKLVKQGPAAMREAAKRVREKKPAKRKPAKPKSPAQDNAPSAAPSECEEPDDLGADQDCLEAGSLPLVDDDWLGDLEHHTGILDTPLFAVDAGLSRRVHALLETELRLAREAFAARNLSPQSAPFFMAASEFLEIADATNWRPCPCSASHRRSPSGAACADCLAAGYLVQISGDPPVVVDPSQLGEVTPEREPERNTRPRGPYPIKDGLVQRPPGKRNRRVPPDKKCA